jgi:hypothetical protein
VCTINFGFSVSEENQNEINVSLLLKYFVLFAKQTDADFHIEQLNGSAQSITNPSNIPTNKEGLIFTINTELLPMESGDKSMWPCPRPWET